MTPASPSLPSVGQTALGVAAIRAAESIRSDRLFSDPFAAGFVRAANYVMPVSPTPPTEDEIRARRRLTYWVAVRTRFLDDVIMKASDDGCRQVVIVAAGLDSRAFRLEWPEGTRLWELDLAEVLAFKNSVAEMEEWSPRCERMTVDTDLSEDWGQHLITAGFDARAPVAWLAEGLLAYLPVEAGDALIKNMADLSVPGSRMGLTLADSERLKQWRKTHPDGATDPGDYVGLWQSSGPENAQEWLASFGWEAQLFNVAERCEAYGRTPEPGLVLSTQARMADAIRR